MAVHDRWEIAEPHSKSQDRPARDDDGVGHLERILVLRCCFGGLCEREAFLESSIWSLDFTSQCILKAPALFTTTYLYSYLLPPRPSAGLPKPPPGPASEGAEPPAKYHPILPKPPTNLTYLLKSLAGSVRCTFSGICQLFLDSLLMGCYYFPHGRTAMSILQGKRYYKVWHKKV